MELGNETIINGLNKHNLFIANENDFLPTLKGVENPNQYFVFAVDEADLPAFEAQRLELQKQDDNEEGSDEDK